MASRRALAALLGLLCPLVLLTGCWNYRGLDKLTVVAGIAIDRADNGNYLVSFETADLSSPVQKEGVTSLVLEAEGATIFDAIRNAKHIEPTKLYFGNAGCIILHESIAREGLDGLFDLFVRLTEFRETLVVIVAKTDRASDLFLPKEDIRYILSYEFETIIDTDQDTTGSSKEVRLYQAYNALRTEGDSLVLPAFDLVEGANGKELPALQGLALFNGDKMDGFLPPEKVQAFLAISNSLKGGVITADADGDGKDGLSFEITKAKTSVSFTEEESSPSAKMEVDITGTIVEVDTHDDLLDDAVTAELDDLLAMRIRDHIASLLNEAKRNQQDIFGLGGQLYRQNPELWERYKENWQEQFAVMPIELSVKVQADSISMLKRS